MITVLFTRRDSAYKTLPGVDVWDTDSDAQRWPGGTPVIVHLPYKKALTCWAIEQVRQWGGVLEHPAGAVA